MEKAEDVPACLLHDGDSVVDIQHQAHFPPMSVNSCMVVIGNQQNMLATHRCMYLSSPPPLPPQPPNI